MKNIGHTLKRLRESKGLTRRDVAEKLSQYGIDISDKTLYGYESGRTSANADMFIALCKIYECTNIIGTFDDDSDIIFTNEEWALIEKFRCLDSSGKETVTSVLDIQYNRCTNNTTDERCTVSDNVVAYKTPILNAAHERTDIEVTDEMRQHDEDIMDDENF